MPDRSVVVADASLYGDDLRIDTRAATPLATGAIGEIRPTDVLVITMDRLPLKGGVITTSRAACPAGTAALLSFAEVLKRGAHAELDIHPDELEVGLQPYNANGFITQRIFLSDSLENGAGYAIELARPDRIRRRPPSRSRRPRGRIPHARPCRRVRRLVPELPAEL